MERKIKVNLLNLCAELPSQSRFRINPLLLGIVVLFFIAGAVVVTAQTVFYPKEHNEKSLPTFPEKITRFFLPSFPRFDTLLPKRLAGQEQDRINILLLGIGGKNHDGAQLTDTIIIASIQPSTKKIAFVSIPRDLLVSLGAYGWRKINNANAFAEMKNPGSGPEFTKEIIQQTFALPIHYYVRVDFDGFAKIIDLVDGVSVSVDKPFTDYQYPTLNKKYQTISFQAGTQTMDGQTALKYTRSRHSAMNNEGSDFARSKRQQKVLAALREKLFSKELLVKPGTIAEILKTLEENITTNAEIPEVIQLANLVKKIDIESLSPTVFDSESGNLLNSDVIDGAYVLRPRDGTFDEMKAVISQIFDTSVSTIKKEAIASEKPHISIKNGTLTEGLATKISDKLRGQGFIVDSISNAKKRDYTTSILIDLSHGDKQKTRELLETTFHVQSTKNYDPQELYKLPLSDFLLILGDDIGRAY